VAKNIDGIHLPVGDFYAGRIGFGINLTSHIETCFRGADGMDCVGSTIMHLIGSHQAADDMVMILIVPIEEATTERLRILDATEALRDSRLVLDRFEEAFRS
jgi:hypothetical protein